MPLASARIVPLLVRLPTRVVTNNRCMPLTPADMVPEFPTPPTNVDTMSRRMPELFAEMVPLLLTPAAAPLLPKIATLSTKMPRFDFETIFPLLLMPPAKVVALVTKIPLEWAETVPVLMMPPPEPVLPRIATPPTKMPRPDFETILPLLLIPPAKVVVLAIKIPLECAEIVPLFVMSFHDWRSRYRRTRCCR
jgi:hypothetical protein